MPRRDVSVTVLWWTGMVLAGVYVAIAVSALSFASFACSLDCGDARRGAFVLTVTSSPLAVAGFGLAALAASRGRPRGASSTVQRVVVLVGGAALMAGGALLALLAVSALWASARELIAGLTGHGITGPLNDPARAREAALDQAALWAIVAMACAALVGAALLVARRVRRIARALSRA